MYKLEIIANKSTWNNFIINSEFDFYSFLDSWEWGEFKILKGFQIFRYGIFDEKSDELIGLLFLIKVEAKRGTYFFCPHGPLIKGSRKNYFEVLDKILYLIKNIAKQENCSFIRLNSISKNTKENKKSYEELGFIDAPMHEHAEDTHLLNLSTSEDEMLTNIKRKDRYLITRAIKEGVIIRIDNQEDHINKLIEFHLNHAKKTNYHAFSEEYIKNIYKVFGDNQVSTISTTFEGNVESILMTIRFGKKCVYYVAASDIKSHKFSPNYLCQWEAIKKAKRDGCDVYNFWGVSPDNNPNHPIQGVTQFKRKFGGYDYSLLHAQDLIVSPKYRINRILETIRRKKRGYYYKKPE